MKTSGVPPCWVDRLGMALWRPWIILPAFAFLLIPSHLLSAGLSTGAAFLKIGTGARPAALGGAYTALANDVDALYYNPGGLAFLGRRELGATHAEWLGQTRFDFIGYAHPTAYGTLGLGVTRLASGGGEARDENRRVIGGFEASDSAYTLSYSRVLARPLLRSGRTSLGGNLKLLDSTIGSYSASAVAFDLGAQHHFDERPASLGLSVLNLGQGMRFLEQRDPLPLTVALGGAWRLGGALSVAADLRRGLRERRVELGLGTEYSVHPNFSVRAGYSRAAGAAPGAAASPLSGLGAGVGIRSKRYRADYTFMPFGELGNAQRISVGAGF